MNDITPPKPAKQDIQDNSDLASGATKANVQADIKTNVGKPVRHWGRLLGFFAIALLLIGAVTGGVWYWNNNFRTFKVGNSTIGKQDFTKTEVALKQARSGKEAPGGKSASQKEAEDRVVLLAALKAEADKSGIAYDNATIDTSLASVYAEQGGKDNYMAYMKSSYGWSPDLVYQYRTVEYLKEKLQNKILINKTFSVIYFRWDVLKERDPAKYEANYAQRKAQLTSKYKQLLDSGQALINISSQVELPGGATKEQSEKAYEDANGTPFMIQTENPAEITYSQAIGEKAGTDPQKFFAAVTKKGVVAGPEQLTDGRVVVVRLESTGTGSYSSWDDYLAAMRKKAGLAVSANKSLSQILRQTLTSAFDQLNILKPQVAHAELINCADHQVPVNFSFTARDKNTGASLSGSSFAAVASRDSQTCNMSNYTANGYTVTGSGRWKTVTKVIWGVPGSITLDCVGYDWAFWAPNVSGYTYVSQSSSGAYANGGRISVVFNYAKAAVKPSCTIGAKDPSIPTGASTLLIWIGNNTPTSASIRSVGGVSPATGGSVSVSPSGTTTYNMTVANSAGSGTCSTTVTVVPPPPNAPTCTLTPANTALPAQGGTVNLEWSSNLGTSWTMTPDIGTPPGANGSKSVTVSTSTQYAYKVSNATASATCYASVTVGDQPPPPPPPSSDLRCTIQASLKGTIPLPDRSGASSDITITKGQTVTLHARAFYGLSLAYPSYWDVSPGNIRLQGSKMSNEAFTDVTPEVTTTYTFVATFPVGQYGNDNLASCTGKVTVASSPLAPTAGPWLKTQHGDVSALGPKGILANRPDAGSTHPGDESDYVVMGVIVNYFCSNNGFNLGSPTVCTTYNPGYRMNTSGFAAGDLGKSTDADGGPDPVIRSIAKILSTPSCDLKSVYKGISNADMAGLLGAANVSFPSDAGCSVAGRGSNNLGAHTFTHGRATIYVEGNLTITGNNTIVSGGSYASINDIPNVGIIVKGDVIVDKDVTNIDASIYATGKIMTCSSYPGGVSCNKPLRVRGIFAAANGFVLGRTTIGDTPAELIVGSGLVDAFPPPGFIDVKGGSSDGVRVLSDQANPRF